MHAKSRTALDEYHPFKAGFRFELRQGQWLSEFLLELDIYHIPSWIVLLGLGIIVIVVGVESSVIGVAFFHDSRDADNRWWCRVAVIKEHSVAKFHRVAERVACLVVAYSVPVGGLVLSFGEIVDTKYFRFAFYQPVAIWRC